MTPLNPDWLQHPALQKFFSIGEFRAVGGCVRDTILGRPVTEIDLATPMLPEQTMQVLAAHHIQVIPTGLTHGTVTALVDGVSFEITTLRKDTATDGRHAQVEYTTEWNEDAERRDFTINALYLSQDGTLTDYTGGLADLKSNHLRFIGNAKTRIQEDYLRILRYYRFLAQLGSTTDDATHKICAEQSLFMSQLSGERIRVEMLKLLAAPNAAPVLHLLHRYRILNHVSPLTNDAQFEALIPLEPTPDPYRRLALWLRAQSNPATALKQLTDRWRLSHQETDRLNILLRPLDLNPPAIKREIRTTGHVADRLMLHAAETGTPIPTELTKIAQTWQAPTFPVAGKDLLSLGLDQGPTLGKALKKLEQIWETSDYQLNKEELLARL
jgi:poly(A) polymerase